MAAIDFASWEAIAACTTAVIGSLAVVWQKLLRPVLRGIKGLVAIAAKVEDALPVLVQIAEQFRPNGGNSLRDVINRIENQLELMHRRQRAMLEYADFGSFEAAADGSCLWVNKRWCDWAGLGDEEARGNGWVTAIHPEDRTVVFQEWLASIKARRDFSLNYRFLNAQTREVTHVRGHARTVRAENGDCYFGVVTKISQEQFLAEDSA